MSRRVWIEVKEFYRLDIEDDQDGTDAVMKLDEMDADDRDGGAYQFRDVQVTDDETGEVLPVDSTEI